MKKYTLHPMQKTIMLVFSFTLLISTASAKTGIYIPKGEYFPGSVVQENPRFDTPPTPVPEKTSVVASSSVKASIVQDSWRPDLSPLLQRTIPQKIDDDIVASATDVMPPSKEENPITSVMAMADKKIKEQPKKKKQAIPTIFEGEASWYGPGFHNKKTANGEIYNQEDMTAAHPLLPMNTIVEVINKDNQRKTQVRINDRGPYKKGRIIDLSHAAAKKLGFVNKGVANVVVKVIQFPDDYSHEEGLEAYNKKVVQVGVMQSEINAQKLKAKAQGLTAKNFYIRKKNNLFYIQSEAYADANKARILQSDLGSQGVSSIVLSYKK